MVSVCFYFQVHQPYRMRHYSIFDIGKNSNYFDDAKNRAVLNKVANKCYLPMNAVLLDLLKSDPRFKVSFSFSGVVLDQFEEYNPDVLRSFQQLVDTKQVDILDETYHHSLSFLFSKDEFRDQVRQHSRRVKQLFGITPTVFRNTELIFNNELAYHVEDMGYKGILAEGADHILGWRSPNFLYRPKTTKSIKLLLKNYRLSDDIAFRFSNKGWSEWPLTVPKYSQWLAAANGNGNVVNLFMDYETFGEHQWEDTGIFEFMRHFPRAVLSHPHNDFVTVSEAVDRFEPVGELDIHCPVSWADVERDLSAWTGNKIQQAAINQIYAIEKEIKATNDPVLIEDWRRLQTSDHFYYMCTKWFNDGDVHKYFNPYDSPYESFIAFMNVFQDLKRRTAKVAVPPSMITV